MVNTKNKSNRNVVYLSREKIKELQNRLDELINVKRKELADKLDWYRKSNEDDGDTGYAEVLMEKENLELEIAKLEDLLARAKVRRKSKSNIVQLGSTVTVKVGNKEESFTIVEPIEADPVSRKLSKDSPVGQALLGAKVGDIVKVVTPVAKTKYKIIDIK